MNSFVNKNKPRYLFSWLAIGTIAILTVADGIRLFGIPVLNAFVLLCCPFVFNYLKLRTKNRADATLILFLCCYCLLIIWIALQALVSGSDIAVDIRQAITLAGFILLIVATFFFVKRIGHIECVLYPVGLAMGAYGLLNVLCIFGVIDPLDQELRNQMDYMRGDGLLDLVVGKGLFYYMTNGNYGILTIFATAVCITLSDINKDSFNLKMCFRIIAGIIIFAGVVVQSRALLIGIVGFVFLLLFFRPSSLVTRVLGKPLIIVMLVVSFAYFGLSFLEFLFSNSSGFSSRFEQYKFALAIISDNFLLGVSHSVLNAQSSHLFGVPIHNYFLRVTAGNGFVGLLLVIIPLLVLLLIAKSQINRLPYIYILLSALIAQVILINFYPAFSLKPLALNIGLTLAYLSMHFEKKSGFNYSIT